MLKSVQFLPICPTFSQSVQLSAFAHLLSTKSHSYCPQKQAQSNAHGAGAMCVSEVHGVWGYPSATGRGLQVMHLQQLSDMHPDGICKVINRIWVSLLLSESPDYGFPSLPLSPIHAAHLSILDGARSGSLAVFALLGKAGSHRRVPTFPCGRNYGLRRLLLELSCVTLKVE